MKGNFFASILFLLSIGSNAQRNPDQIFSSNIHTPLLYQQNNQVSMPIIRLNSQEVLELHFDDFDADAKNYFYTYELCNANWEPVNLSSFDYIKGYQQQRIAQYRFSSISQTPYTHYQANIPDRNCIPSKSGNYILKVFLNGNANNPAFTKRFYVVDGKAGIGMNVLQPFGNQFFKTHQKVQVTVNATALNPQSPQQQMQLIIMQNNRLDNVITNLQPAFIRGNMIEYNGELDCIFPAGKEYRWADLRSFRFQSERIDKIDKSANVPFVYLKPDFDRTANRYLFYTDYNGAFFIDATEQINPFWQSDYAWVKFTYVPTGNIPFNGKNVYLLGALTGNQVGDTAQMQFNSEKVLYEKTMYLKQGFYSYTYVTKDVKKNSPFADATLTDGNYWETENEYAAFVYYRGFSSRHDELVGITLLNSRSGERVAY